MDINNLSQTEISEFLNLLKTNKAFRIKACSESHFAFFYTYFNHHLKYEPAEFHKELFSFTDSHTESLVAITAFRGSGKSTIMSLSFPIWAILGKLKRKYVLVISQTQQQSSQILYNIRSELENNELLINDFGNFVEDSNEWNSSTITMPKLGARITALSTGSNIRGTKHNQYRPDIIICDDIESLDSVKTQEGRQNTYNWFFKDVRPSGDIGTRVIVIGNLLHEDSLLSRLKDEITLHPEKGIYKEYPLILEDNSCLWSSKFTTEKSIQELKDSIFDDVAWQREYLLKIVSDASRVILPEWIKRYDYMPSVHGSSYKKTSIGIDPAISEKTTADYTGIVTAHLFEYQDGYEIYILPNVVNKRVNFTDAVETIKTVALSLNVSSSIELNVENVGYQEALVQYMKKLGFKVNAVNPTGDKRIRLSSLAPSISNGTIIFPNFGCEELINQLLNFGVEKHDDLADALVYAVRPLIDYANRRKARVWTHKPQGF